ncbi:MAG: (2Fe-2S)-binding protein [Methylococcales bacterium]|nr:(2Fe-2S)-binding protein [Methylococcales bacterium]
MSDDKLILCHCMEVTKGTVQDAINAGASTFLELVEKTKASTGCGSCAIYLHEMLGESVKWTAVTAINNFFVANDIKSYRLIAVDKSYQFPKHQPGNYILVKANIKGKWVCRPYAISSMRSESAYREIIIKRKPGGEFTEWIFNQKPPIELFISDPQGDSVFNIEDEASPIICFAGGVGVTPVISACRSIYNEQKNNHNFHIDYSTTGHTGISIQPIIEFHKVITKTEGFSFNVRNTTVEGNINFKDIKKVVIRANAKTLYYVSGPTGYELHVQKGLLKAGVNSQNIYPLSSKNLIDSSLKPKTSKPFREQFTFKPYFYIGIVLFLCFLIQDLFSLKIPALENLQLQEYYKRWTGYGLLAYFSFQWSYPLIRMLRENKYFIGYQNLHKITGAFAPAVFYLHSTRLGYAYLFVLSVVYLLNFLLPLCNKDNFQSLFENKTVYKTWLGSHVFLSITVSSLMFYHMFNAFSYS